MAVAAMSTTPGASVVIGQVGWQHDVIVDKYANAVGGSFLLVMFGKWFAMSELLLLSATTWITYAVCYRLLQLC